MNFRGFCSTACDNDVEQIGGAERPSSQFFNGRPFGMVEAGWATNLSNIVVTSSVTEPSKVHPNSNSSDL